MCGSCSKSSSASGTSRRSVSSSLFSFRSGERAAKRKEASLTFFKKLEDKMNSQKAENPQMQRRSKISSTFHQPPKSGRKSSPSTVQDANSRPPRWPSINTESSKHVLRKNNRITCSVTTLPKNRHENASPNIQLSVGKGSISVAGGCSH
ncbi:hypothetical protein PTKIN_Ptkin17bG0094200 [Pterospermum kingtungense]